MFSLDFIYLLFFQYLFFFSIDSFVGWHTNKHFESTWTTHLDYNPKLDPFSVAHKKRRNDKKLNNHKVLHPLNSCLNFWRYCVYQGFWCVCFYRTSFCVNYDFINCLQFNYDNYDSKCDFDRDFSTWMWLNKLQRICGWWCAVHKLWMSKSNM